METKMEQFPATNPNPVLSVAKDGTVLYSNVSGEPLLNVWGVGVGEKLPSYIGDLVQRVISLNSPEKMEVKAGNRVYLISLYHLPEDEHVNIYGFDISDQKGLEGKLREAYENLHVQNEESKAHSEEHKKANEEILRSEERYRELFESSVDGIIITDLAGNILKVNPAFEKMLGYSMEELQHLSYQQLTPAQWHESEEHIVREQIFEHGYSDEYEKEYIRKDGSIFPISIRVWLSRDKQGQPRGMWGLIRDITERKHMEEKLKQSVKQYQTLGDTIPYGVWITDAEGYCTYASDSFLELMDMSMEQVQKFGWMHRLPPEDAQPTTDHWLRCVHTGEDFEREHRFRAKDGSYRNVLAIGRPVRNDAGIITEWVGLNLDVTERKHMEEALKKAHDSLDEKVKERTAELEEAYSSLLENEIRLSEAQKIAHLGNWDWNLLTDKLYWSDEIYRIFRLDPLEFGATYDAFLDYVHPDDRDYVDNAVKEALNGEFLSIEYRITLPDRGERIVYAQGEVTLDEKHTPIRMRGILQDITESKKAEEALGKIDKIRIKEIHHRIKNNLQVISSMLDLQSEMFEDEKVKEAFREGQDRVISMALIHEELYKGKGTDTDTLDFSAYIQKLAKSLFQTYNLSNKNIRLSMDLEENTFLDMDIAVPLGIIVNELVSNSLKHAFTDRDKGEIRIQLRREESEDCKSTGFILTVSDNGVGIPENLDIEDLDSLGLQLVTSLVDQLDGELELKRDNGTEFTVRFTVIEKDNQESEPAPQLI